MSNLEHQPAEALAGGGDDVAVEPVRELLEGRDVVLGGTRGMPVVRTLPNKTVRMVGAWCFLDHFGGAEKGGLSRGTDPMRVAPHPHTGLQTVTWLVEGTVRHRDSLGSDQLIRPGQLNLMTSGRGIAHAEESPPAEPDAPTQLHGVQLWVALPHADRDVEPAFEHHADLPVVEQEGARLRLIIGELDGLRSPARAYTPIVGAEASLDPGGSLRLDLAPGFEYAALTLTGRVEVDGLALGVGPLLYLGCGRNELVLRAPEGGRVLLLGGKPFEEQIVMWWNFIGRSHDEIMRARAEWMEGGAFGVVRGYEGDPLPAPEMPTTTMLPRGRTR